MAVDFLSIPVSNDREKLSENDQPLTNSVSHYLSDSVIHKLTHTHSPNGHVQYKGKPVSAMNHMGAHSHSYTAHIHLPAMSSIVGNQSVTCITLVLTQSIAQSLTHTNSPAMSSIVGNQSWHA